MQKSKTELLEFNYAGLRRVISGGQTGADQAGLAAGRSSGFETGGFAPLGFRTLRGFEVMLKDKYNLVETIYENYSKRTELNVLHSDGTVRLATNFQSAGEICTIKAIRKHGKPFLDIDLTDPQPNPLKLLEFVLNHKITTLNVAGNADRNGSNFHFFLAYEYLTNAFMKLS